MLIFAASLLAASAAGGDYCLGQVPSDLTTQLQSSYPAFRVPVASDNLAEDIRMSRSAGGSGCLGIAKGDFDGDGRRDLVIGLRSREQSSRLIVIALRGRTGWRLETLGTWSNYGNRLYVATDGPGTYERSEALEGPIQGKGEVMSMKCPHDVAVFGATESTGTAYCSESRGWVHVRIAD